MSFEEEYEDILQNIEFAIIQEYQQDPKLLDYDVADALEALIRAYRAEAGGRTPTELRLEGKPRLVLDAVRAICEWRLGRSESDAGSLPRVTKPISVSEIVDCLKRIEKSVHRWNKQNGRQGYLNFVSKYIV